MKTLVSVTLIAGFLFAAVPAQAWPDCTCDPNPVTNLLYCLVNGERCPTPPSPPEVTAPDLGELDPRNWPCTCDPMPQPWGVEDVLA